MPSRLVTRGMVNYFRRVTQMRSNTVVAHKKYRNAVRMCYTLELQWRGIIYWTENTPLTFTQENAIRWLIRTYSGLVNGYSVGELSCQSPPTFG